MVASIVVVALFIINSHFHWCLSRVCHPWAIFLLQNATNAAIIQSLMQLSSGHNSRLPTSIRHKQLSFTTISCFPIHIKPNPFYIQFGCGFLHILTFQTQDIFKVPPWRVLLYYRIYVNHGFVEYCGLLWFCITMGYSDFRITILGLMYSYT